VAGEGGSEEQVRASHGPRECMACRGTGQVVSHLGGDAKSVSCPWCAGTGMRSPGVDAQASWKEREQQNTDT